MKKQLTVTGKVSLSREEITKLIDAHLKQQESLGVVKAIFPSNFDEVVVEVRGNNIVGDQISTTFDRPLLQSQGGNRYIRPNYGIGKFLKTRVFQNGERKEFTEIYAIVHRTFPNMTPELLANYLPKNGIKQVEVGVYKK